MKGNFICWPLLFKWMAVFQSWLDYFSIEVWAFIQNINFLSSVFFVYWCPFVTIFNPIQDGHFRGFSQMGWGGQKGRPLPKIRHTYPTMIKLDTVIPYLKKIQKIYESRDTSPEFWWRQHFFTENQQILLYQEIQT